MKLLRKIVIGTLVFVLAFSIASCDALNKASKKSKKKDKDGKDEKQLVTLLEEFSSALIDFDSKTIKKLSAEIDEDGISFIEEHSFDEDVVEVAEAFFDTITYEVEEDSIDFDDDEATAVVVFSYCDIDSCLVETFTTEEWIDAIQNCEEVIDLEIEFELTYDDDELYVDNADDVISDFYDVVLDYDIYVDNTVYYYDAVEISFGQDKYTTEDSIDVVLKFDDIDELDGQLLGVTLSTQYGHTQYMSTGYISGGEKTITFDALGDNSSGGEVSITVDCFDDAYYVYECATINVSEPAEDEEVGILGFEELLDFGFTVPEEDISGEYSDGVYTNNALGFCIDFPTEYMNISGDTIFADLDVAPFKIVDCFFTSEFSVRMFLMVTSCEETVLSGEDIISLLSYDDGEIIYETRSTDQGHEYMYAQLTEEEVTYYIFASDDYLVFIVSSLESEEDGFIVDECFTIY